MPSPQQTRCRACLSAHREEIDRRLIDGTSPRAVSDWLRETHGEAIPFQALHNHRAAHVREGIKAEVKRMVAERVPPPAPVVPKAPMSAPMAEAVIERMHHLDLLAWVAGQARMMAESVNINLEKPGMGAVTLYLGCLREVREVAMATHEILEGDRPVEVNAHIDSLGDLLGLALSPQPQPPPADKPTDP